MHVTLAFLPIQHGTTSRNSAAEHPAEVSAACDWRPTLSIGMSTRNVGGGV